MSRLIEFRMSWMTVSWSCKRRSGGLALQASPGESLPLAPYESKLVWTPVQRAYPRRMGIEVLPATGRWDDFASFMVPRKPGGRGCVCIAYRNSSLDMPGRIAHMRALCAGEPGPGVLAYVDGEVAGWCSVAPKSTYRALVNSRTIPHVQDEGAWSVVCFVVRPGYRRRGLSTRPSPPPSNSGRQAGSPRQSARWPPRSQCATRASTCLACC